MGDHEVADGRIPGDRRSLSGGGMAILLGQRGVFVQVGRLVLEQVDTFGKRNA